jgi:probable HAF family extracellular repeat protein
MRTPFRFLCEPRSTRSALPALLTALFIPLIPLQLFAQPPATHHHYKLFDLGTFGGPTSAYFSDPVVASANNRGMVVGGADTSMSDPYAPFCFDDCHVMHAFEWRDGVLNDLGSLPNGVDSAALWINERGLVMGFADNGLIDPLSGTPEQDGVVWKDGQIEDLGTLGGNFSYPNAMNDEDEVVGFAYTAIPDPFSYFGLGTQAHAFRWHHGHMQDLGTLGGPDSWAAFVNERGQIAGWSYTDSTPNATTGVPTQHPFLWENGKMQDLNTLGGTFAVVGSLAGGGGGAVNNRGQVVGTSNLAGDQTYHPFLWDRGVLTDLATLGGDNGEAYWINDAGQIVGRTDTSGNASHHAVLWDRGTMTDLGVAAGFPCSTAIDINERGQVIIDTGICNVGGGPGLLWENGGPSVDLNTLLLPGSGLTVGDVNYINDRGEIAATGMLPNGDLHAVLLVPCDYAHRGMDGCDYDMVEASAAVSQAGPAVGNASSRGLPRSAVRGTSRYRLTGRAIGPRQ